MNSSLILKFSAEKKADSEDINNKLSSLRKNANAEIERGSDHQDHKCEVFRDEIDDDSEDMNHLSCKDCRKFFKGKLQTGIHCNTCDDLFGERSLFHKECFASNKEEEEAEEVLDDPEDLLIIPVESIKIT